MITESQTPGHGRGKNQCPFPSYYWYVTLWISPPTLTSTVLENTTNVVVLHMYECTIVRGVCFVSVHDILVSKVYDLKIVTVVCRQEHSCHTVDVARSREYAGAKREWRSQEQEVFNNQTRKGRI